MPPTGAVAETGMAGGGGGPGHSKDLGPVRLRGLQIGAPAPLRGAEAALSPLPKPPQGEEGIQPQPPPRVRGEDRACLGALEGREATGGHSRSQGPGRCQPGWARAVRSRTTAVMGSRPCWGGGGHVG